MTDTLKSLRHVPQMPGNLLTVLHEFDARLEALEKHLPMLSEIETEWEEHIKREVDGEPEALTLALDPTLPVDPAPVVDPAAPPVDPAPVHPAEPADKSGA